jgi:2Fe-2S ferredoxin
MPKVTFKKNRVLDEDVTLEGEVGQTILEVAAERGVPVGSNCGGVCGCSTCHVYVMRGFDDLEEMEDAEADRLDRAFDVRLNSRLGCQAELSDTDLVIDIAEESLKAYFDENPEVRKHFEATGEFKFVPHGH